MSELTEEFYYQHRWSIEVEGFKSELIEKVIYEDSGRPQFTIQVRNLVGEKLSAFALAEALEKEKEFVINFFYKTSSNEFKDDPYKVTSVVVTKVNPFQILDHQSDSLVKGTVTLNGKWNR